MTEVVEKLTDGDVYRWRYRETKNPGLYGDYHCCSCIAVVHRERLRDTFWQIGMNFNDGRSFGIDDLPRLNLELVGNMADLVSAKEYEADYYDDADIVNLNHSNSSRGNFYLRKGAKRSLDKMLATARQRFAEAEDDFHTARRRMDEIGKIIDQIVDGKPVSYIPSWR